jgi:hypothetical protein
LTDKKATQEIEITRRKSVFVKWFNYVHVLIEMERQADYHLKNQRF